MGSSGETNFGVERVTVVAIALGVNAPCPSIHVPVPIPMMMTAATTAMIPGSIHREINQPICRIPSFGTLVTYSFKM